ncbi:hypothetical protein SDJN02_19245, partial [Cucurbita argyrosperma subsp. argyrosperma]
MKVRKGEFDDCLHEDPKGSIIVSMKTEMKIVRMYQSPALPNLINWTIIEWGIMFERSTEDHISYPQKIQKEMPLKPEAQDVGSPESTAPPTCCCCCSSSSFVGVPDGVLNVTFNHTSAGTWQNYSRWIKGNSDAEKWGSFFFGNFPSDQPHSQRFATGFTVLLPF